MKYAVVIFGYLVLLSGCIERIDLEESLSGEQLLVVDGLITDADEPYSVKLTYTSPTLQTYEGDPVIGAEVYITDEESVRANLLEFGNGEYLTDPSTFRGQVGKTYQLQVVLPDGNSYVSLPETMPVVPPIDSIYYALASEDYQSSLGTILQRWGVQFYLNTGSGRTRPAYYQWRWQETYSFIAPLARPMQLVIPLCFRSGAQARYLNVASTEDLRSDRIIRREINFVAKSGLQLQRRYSLLVQQYSMTERAYRFWANVQQQQTDGGSVFAPPPAPIPGNITNASDDRERVLGYFQVSAVTEKRIFVNRGQVPPGPGGSPGANPGCVEGDPEAAESCFDCTLLPGITTEVPSFW